jgi:hypothetical protein
LQDDNNLEDVKHPILRPQGAKFDVLCLTGILPS